MKDYASDLIGKSAPAKAGTDYAGDILGGKKANGPQISVPTEQENFQALKDTGKDLPAHFVRAVRGFMQGAGDLPVGLAQLVSKFGPDKLDQAVNEYIKTREEEYQASRGDYADRADIGRLTGTVVASMPIGGKAAAATLPGRMVQGAKVGAALGAATPVNPDSENFALDKAIQVGGGAVTGALAVPATEYAIKAIGATANAVSNFLKGLPARATHKTTQNAIEQTLTVELQKNGVNFADLSKQARDSLILETQKALRAGGQVDDAAAARIADFIQTGVNPTRGQVSRNPYDFALERNLGKTEVGAPLARRFNEQNTGLIRAVDEARTNTGAVAADAFDAGNRVMSAMRADDDAIKAGVDTAYKAARDEVGRAAPVSAAEFSRNANLKLDEDMLGHYLPAEVRNILNDVSAGKIPLNVDTMVKIDQVLSGAQRTAGNGSPQALAIGKVRDALNAAPIESEAGESAKAAFDAARSQAKSRFARIESIPALADMLKNKTIQPEDFVNDYVIRGGVNDVRSLMTNLPPGARRDVRGAVVDWIKSRAVSGSEDTATFSQAAYNKALDAIGERNLRTIFENSPQILDQLRRIGRVAAHVQKAPISSGVNYSSSATAIIDMLDKVGRLPIVGSLAGKPGDIARATQVTKSLSPAAPTAPAKPFMTIDMIDDLSRSGGRLAAPFGAALTVGH